MTTDAMPAVPHPGRARHWLRLWHRVFGLGAGAWLVLLALTGSVIAFYDDLDTWLNPQLRQIDSPAAHPVDADAALASVRAVLPDFTPRLIDLPDAAGETLRLLGSATVAGAGTTVQAFVDPRDATLLGWRDSERFSLHPLHLMDSMYALHTELLLHETGVWLIGLLALLWMVDHLVALVLAVPRAAAWRTAWRIGGRGTNLRRIYDLHRAPGLWLFPLTLVLALSGWCLSWYAEARGVVGVFAPVSERLHIRMPPAAGSPGARIGVNAALSVVNQKPGNIDSVVVLPRQGLYGVRSFDPRDVDDLGRLWTYVSMRDGALVGQRHDIGEGPGDTFLAWQYPLHSGRAFGSTGQLLVGVTGLAVALLGISGTWLWWRRRRQSGRS